VVWCGVEAAVLKILIPHHLLRLGAPHNNQHLSIQYSEYIILYKNKKKTLKMYTRVHAAVNITKKGMWSSTVSRYTTRFRDSNSAKSIETR